MGYQSDVVCERASAYLRSLGGPWFAVVSLESPHPQYAAPAGTVAPRDPAGITLRGNVPPEAEVRARRELSGYYAHIEATDRSIGRLLDGLPRETHVVVTSVHGDMHGSHGLFRKGWPHEESVRVPLLMRVPGAARRDERPISLVELPAIAVAWACGSRGPAALSPDDPGRPARISMPSVVALPDQCDRAWSGLRTRSRKLVLNADGTPWLFFDLERDPLETTNLARDPARAAEISALLDRAAG